MILKVEKDGLLIPPDLVAGTDEIRLRTGDDKVIVLTRRSDEFAIFPPPAEETASADPGLAGPRTLMELWLAGPIPHGPSVTADQPSKEGEDDVPLAIPGAPVDDDPIFRWGDDPIDGGDHDAAERHDSYIYGSGE